MRYYQRQNHEQLINAVQEWESNHLFAPRMHIVKDALNAHCNGTYTLSIPALLPLIEGICNDYVRFNNLPVKFGNIEQVYNAAIGDVNSYDLSTWAIATTLLYQLKTSTYVYSPFEAELDKSLLARSTSRHTVLHGITINYDKPVNSLKLFLILDALSALNDIEVEEAA